MQFSHALIALVAASLANAQLPNIPACSMNCFVTALTTDGCSNLTDFKCHCSKGDKLTGQITPCVQKACDVADQSSVSSVVVAQCSSVGVPVSVPPVGGSSSSSAAPPSSSSSSSASGSASGSSSGSASGSMSTPCGTESMTPTGGSTPTVSASATPSASASPAPSGSSPSSSSPAPFKGAGSNVAVNMGGAAAALLAVAAYL